MLSGLALVVGAVADFLQGLNLPLVLSIGSSCITGYFWLVKMNQERAGVRMFRAGDFRPDRLQSANEPGKEKATWYGEVFLTNRSTLPAAVLQFQPELFWKGRWLPGKLVLEKKDNVPWTIEPLRVLARSFGCAFLVEEGTPREQLLQAHQLRFTFVTLDGCQRVQVIETCQKAPVLPAQAA
jgi:hypothetical protein